MKAPGFVPFALLIGLVLSILLVGAHLPAVAQALPPPPTVVDTDQSAWGPVSPLPTANAMNLPRTEISLFFPLVFVNPDHFLMVLVPGGLFQMGCKPGNPYDPYCGGDYFNGERMETPLHWVNVSTFYIDKYEVTNARYAACVKAGKCLAPRSYSSSTRRRYYDDPAFANYPVLNVDWYQAAQFCAWDGKRLPTEAEWEKAARGPDDIRIYPWGNTGLNCGRANYYAWSGYCVGDTTEVGHYPGDISPYGAMDMTGNAWEWVSDWYDRYYYQSSPLDDPTGPSGPQSYPDCSNCRVVRGGAWDWRDRYARISYRGRLPTDYFAAPYHASPNPPSSPFMAHLGFRCAKR